MAAAAHPPLPASLGQARGDGYQNVAPAEAHKLIEGGGATYLDVRCDW